MKAMAKMYKNCQPTAPLIAQLVERWTVVEGRRRPARLLSIGRWFNSGSKDVLSLQNKIHLDN